MNSAMSIEVVDKKNFPIEYFKGEGYEVVACIFTGSSIISKLCNVIVSLLA